MWVGLEGREGREEREGQGVNTKGQESLEGFGQQGATEGVKPAPV